MKPLSADGSVPGMDGWRWVPTLGHSPGHVSLKRQVYRTLIAGDAFVTTAQESAYAAALQSPEMHGPPRYFTIDWEMARTSVETLAGLAPSVVIAGHGRAMQGPAMTEALGVLARDFAEVAVPTQGLYVNRPARVEHRSAHRAP